MLAVYIVTDISANQVYSKDLFEHFNSVSNSMKLKFTQDVEKADLYIFCTQGLSKNEIINISTHPLVKKAIRKCYLICDNDFPIPILPGLYTALPKLKMINQNSWNRHFRTIFYLADHNPYIRELSIHKIIPQYLFSFIGSPTSRIRKKIFNLPIDRSDVLIKKTDSTSFWENFVWISGIRKTAGNESYLYNYASIIFQSKFILCPKGNGISSYRFFEVMEAGRIPVLISDNYVLPSIPYNWDDIILRVRERDIPYLTEIISANEKRFESMASLNRKVYYECFSNKALYIQNQLHDLSAVNPVNSQIKYLIFRVFWVMPLRIFYSAKPAAGRFLKFVRHHA